MRMSEIPSTPSVLTTTYRYSCQMSYSGWICCRVVTTWVGPRRLALTISVRLGSVYGGSPYDIPGVPGGDRRRHRAARRGRGALGTLQLGSPARVAGLAAAHGASVRRPTARHPRSNPSGPGRVQESRRGQSTPRRRAGSKGGADLGRSSRGWTNRLAWVVAVWITDCVGPRALRRAVQPHDPVGCRDRSYCQDAHAPLPTPTVVLGDLCRLPPIHRAEGSVVLRRQPRNEHIAAEVGADPRCVPVRPECAEC